MQFCHIWGKLFFFCSKIMSCWTGRMTESRYATAAIIHDCNTRAVCHKILRCMHRRKARCQLDGSSSRFASLTQKDRKLNRHGIDISLYRALTIILQPTNQQVKLIQSMTVHQTLLCKTVRFITNTIRSLSQS